MRFANNLAKLAAMSGRILVWPEADCRCPFILKIKNWNKDVDSPLPIRDWNVVMHGSVSDMRCMFAYLFNRGCSGVGLTSSDFEAACLALGIPYGDNAILTSNNTLLLDRYSPLPPADFTNVTWFRGRPQDPFRGWVGPRLEVQDEVVLDAALVGL